MFKSRTIQVLLVVAVACGVVPRAVSAAPAMKQDDLLAATWKTVLEAPSDQNPFGTGGQAFACIDVGRTVAPLAPNGVESCTLRTGTALFVIGRSFECDSFEGQGTTDAELRRCARQSDAGPVPTVTVDGAAVGLTQVETPLMSATAPAGNLFDVPPGTEGEFVAHGWVVLLNPLTPGQHSVTIDDGDSTTLPITTSILVKHGRAA